MRKQEWRDHPYPNARGQPLVDASFFVIFNSHFETLSVLLPPQAWGSAWIMLLDTAHGWIDYAPAVRSGASLQVAPQSVLLQRKD